MDNDGNNTCKLKPGDRVIPTTEAVEKHGFRDDMVLTVATVDNTRQRTPLKFVEVKHWHPRELFECEHDSHCGICGIGQCDIGSGSGKYPRNKGIDTLLDVVLDLAQQIEAQNDRLEALERVAVKLGFSIQSIESELRPIESYEE